MTMRALLTLALLLTTASPLLADPHQPLTYNRISFSEQASQDVENDLLVANLFVQREGRRADRLASEINQIVNQVVDRLKGIQGLKVQTQSYRTNAVYKKGEVAGWRVHQSIRIESRDSQLLGKTIAEVQESMSVQSIGYQVSEASRRKHTEALIDVALKRFQQRAQNIRRAMGKQGVRIVRITINDGSNPNPGPVYRNDMMMESRSMVAAAPARIEAGTQRVAVSVSGEIELID